MEDSKHSDSAVISRVLQTMKYYQSLDTNNATEHIIIYWKEQHKCFLDDYILILTNSNICDKLRSRINTERCEFKKCPYALHFYRDRKKKTKIVNDVECHFIRDVMDSCHCYLYHIYDIGLRIKIDKDKCSLSEQKHEGSNIDYMFSNLVHTIQRKKTELQKLRDFDFTRYDYNKFNFGSQGINYHSTFMDGLRQYITLRSLSIPTVFIHGEYDSDAVEYDILQSDQKESNIAASLCSNSEFNAMKQFIRQYKLSKYSFQIGYRFYYWEYYKTLTETDYVQRFHNIYDHSGYAPSELYISAKYKSIKQEILHNQIYSLNISQLNVSIGKANAFIHTSKSKTIKALNNYKRRSESLHFGIEKGTKLSATNLLSVILYTDWTYLCSEFSKTFRKLHEYESLEVTKCRNKEFANWSRILRETVEYFGKLGYDENRDNIQCERGPFFCGLNFVMMIPQFNIRLCSPTSTSKQLTVATRFADDEGIIIQLNNNGNSNSCMLRSWNCSWLSNYIGEDEVIWMGGRYPIKLETVKNVKTHKNYYSCCKALFYFECMITGVNMKKKDAKNSKVTQDDWKLLSGLINGLLGIHKNKYCKYVNDTFKAFVHNKKEIVINLLYVELYFSKLKDLLFYPISTSIKHELFKPVLFKLFRNVRSIVINTTSWDFDGKQCEYVFDTESFKLLMKHVKNNNVTITLRAMHKYKVKVNTHNRMVMGKNSYCGVSWLFDMWSQKLSSICSIETRNMNYGKHMVKEDFLTLSKHN